MVYKKFEDICEQANNLILVLETCDNNTLVDYIVSEISSDGFCSLERYSDFIGHDIEDEEV